MKRFAYAAAVLAIVASSLGAMFITQDQARSAAVLTQLEFELIPPKDRNIVGAAPQYKLGKDTVKHLEGKVIEVQNDGSLKIK